MITEGYICRKSAAKPPVYVEIAHRRQQAVARIEVSVLGGEYDMRIC
jgi:hypothetical protein